jgi:hypothetical protein
MLKIPGKRLGAEELARNEVKRRLKKATDKGAKPPRNRGMAPLRAVLMGERRFRAVSIYFR